jgi:hypothetical protein
VVIITRQALGANSRSQCWLGTSIFWVDVGFIIVITAPLACRRILLLRQNAFGSLTIGVSPETFHEHGVEDMQACALMSMKDRAWHSNFPMDKFIEPR